MQTAWDDVAEKRNEQIESGTDITFNKLFVPYYAEILSRHKPAALLDVGCGTGHLLKALRSHAGKAVGIDPSAKMVALAERVLAGHDVELHNCPVERFSHPQKFDLALSHFCLQGVPNLSAFIGSVANALRPNGLFIFSIPHPCFWNDYQPYISQSDFSYMKVLTVSAELSVRGESVGSVPYTHRPLRDYFSALCENGYKTLLMDEIYPRPDIEALYGESWRWPRYAVFFCEKNKA